ncbi:hypothetical protein GCM10028807_62860 [Spirosoma daeguense]
MTSPFSQSRHLTRKGTLVIYWAVVHTEGYKERPYLTRILSPLGATCHVQGIRKPVSTYQLEPLSPLAIFLNAIDLTQS